VPPLRFEPIDLQRNVETCVTFRRDSHFCSFGAGEAFDNVTGGVEGYLSRLGERLKSLPEGIVHVWRNGRIVGQIEAQVPAGGVGGYVNLLYLVPEERGRGVGGELHDYVVALFRRLGLPSVRLSVSLTNTPALRYYSKHGWRDVGPRPGFENVHVMELALAPGSLG
jgi:ribosomal protein S18 acetylase RimI-like enzyme